MAKSYDPDEKMEIVLRFIKGEKTSDLVDEYGVSRTYPPLEKRILKRWYEQAQW